MSSLPSTAAASSRVRGPRALFNEFIRKLIADLEIESFDLSQQRVLRDDLLFCLHNKAPFFNLSKSSFLNLVDTLRTLLREAGAAGDYKNITATFRVSQLYGRTIGSYEYTLLSSLASHEVWGLEGFWLQATDALLSRDIFRWHELSSASKSSGLLGSDLKDTQLYSLFAIHRIQAVAFGSMRRLGVSVDVIASYLDKVMLNYMLSSANIDITQRMHESVVMKLLDLGVERAINKPSNVKHKHKQILHTLSTQSSGGDGSDDMKVVQSRTMLHPRCKHIAVGYSAIIEVIFYLAALQDPKSALSRLLEKMAREKEYSEDGAHRGNLKAKMKKYDLKCLCGMPLNEWRPLGLFDSFQKHREHMNYFLSADSPESFLSIFYGNAAGRSGWQHTSGVHVRTQALGSFSFSMSSVTFKRRDKTKTKHNLKSLRSTSHAEAEGTFISDSGSDFDDDSSIYSDGVSTSSESVLSTHSYGGHSDSEVHSDDPGRGGDLGEGVNNSDNKGNPLQQFVVMMQAGVDVIKIKTSPFTRHLNRTVFLDARAQELCWLKPGRAELVPVQKSSVPISSIQQVKVGKDKFEQCISIICDTKTLLFKVEDKKQFQQLLDGFILITETNKKKKNNRQTHFM